MKIVVLDGYTLNPGDLSWEGLQSLGRCEIYDRTPADKVRERADGAEILLTNKVLLTKEVMESLPKLRYIGVLATGYNVVDIEAARLRGVTVCNVPAYGTASVAQAVFALILEMTSQVGHHSSQVAEGRWSRSPDFCFWDRPLVELEGLTMGIVGYGRIGRAVAALAKAFGMKVAVSVRHPEALAGEDVEPLDLDTLFESSDLISLHCPLTEKTEGVVDARRLALMKPRAYLVNTGRGPLIDERALADALEAGTIAGAGLDVLSAEPPGADSPLVGAKNCFITPHIAWATTAARKRLMEIAVANVAAFLAGDPQNRVG